MKCFQVQMGIRCVSAALGLSLGLPTVANASGGAYQWPGIVDGSMTYGRAFVTGSAREVATGDLHTLLLKEDGTVWAWGSNSVGQLGPATIAGSSTAPVQIPGLSSIVAVAAGGDCSMALDVNGDVFEWGQGNPFPTKIEADGFDKIVAIAAGQGHCLALRFNGNVFAWGENGSGQLGNGTFLPSSMPVLAKVGSRGVPFRAVGIAAGGEHSILVREDGTVQVWGDNSHGQLGLGEKEDQNLPTPLNIGGVRQVSAGLDHSALLMGDGSVRTAGANDRGQLGLGDMFSRSSFTEVTGLNSDLISAGRFYNMARTTDGQLVGWGWTVASEDGGTTLLSPTIIGGYRGVTGISANSPACAAPFSAASLPGVGGQSTVVALSTTPLVKKIIFPHTRFVTGGNSSTLLIRLDQRVADEGGLDLTISSARPDLIHFGSANVNVPEGNVSILVPFSTTTVGEKVSVPIIVTGEGFEYSAQSVELVPTKFESFTMSPGTVKGGDSVTVTVNLSSAAPAGGFTVTFSSARPRVFSVPTMTIPAGQSSMSVSVPTAVVTAQSKFTVQALYDGQTAGRSLTVTP